MYLAEKTAVTALRLSPELRKKQSHLAVFDVFSRSFRQHTLPHAPHIETRMRRLAHFHSRLSDAVQNICSFLFSLLNIMSTSCPQLNLLAYFQQLPANFWTDVIGIWQEVHMPYLLPPVPASWPKTCQGTGKARALVWLFNLLHHYSFDVFLDVRWRFPPPHTTWQQQEKKTSVNPHNRSTESYFVRSANS